MTAFNKSPEGGFVQVQLPVVVGTWRAAPSGCRGKTGRDKRRHIPWLSDSDARLWDETAKAAE